MCVWCVAYRKSEDVRAEEQRMKTANERAIAEMQQRMERELEHAKLELLEVRLPGFSVVLLKKRRFIGIALFVTKT